MVEPPLPFGHAAARGFYVLLKGLVERGHRVTAFAPFRNTEDYNLARDTFPFSNYDLRLYRVPSRRGLRSKWETLRRPFSYIFSPELLRDLSKECDGDYDVMHLETTWSGWLGRLGDSSRVVLNLHSLYSIDLADQPIRSLSNLFHNRLRRRAERHLLRRYPTLLTLSPRLKGDIQKVAKKSSVHVVPLGLDLSLYPFISSDVRSLEPVVSLIGSMDWYPSRSAAIRLLTRLWPEIKKKIPNSKLRIVGWHARSVLRNFLSEPDVEVFENVPDIQPYFESTNVLLYTPDRGTGMKVKVLEAFAYGVPVVTTTDGIEGLPAQDGVHVGVCDSDEGLIERTISLIKDPDRQEKQRISARLLLESYCNPQTVLDGIEKCYIDMLIRRRGQHENI